MFTFDHTHYLAILPTQRGERMAVRELTDEVRNKFTPLWELHDIPLNKDDEPTRLIGEHITKTIDALAKVPSLTKPFFFDLPHVDNAVRLSDGRHPIVAAFGRMREAQLLCIPVVTLDRDVDYLRGGKGRDRDRSAWRNGSASHRRICCMPSALVCCKPCSRA